MKTLKNICDFLIFGNIFIALAAAFLVRMTYMLLGIEPEDVIVEAFSFFSTLFIYNMNLMANAYKFEDDETHSEMISWALRNINSVRNMMFLSVPAMLVCVIMFPAQIIFTLVVMGFISVAYTLPFVPTKNGWIGFSGINYLKIFLIAFVWTVVTVVIPVVNSNELSLLYKPEFLSLFISRALFVFAITIPFDIRDLKMDLIDNVQTIPMYFGIEKSNRVSLLLLAVSLLFSVVFYSDSFPRMVLLSSAFLISFAVAAYLVVRTTGKNGDYHYSFALDGTLMLQALLVMGAIYFS